MIDLSVVIVNFKTPNLVVDCVESLKNEGSAFTKEIIIIDNGSKDESVKILSNLAEKDENIKLIINSQNEGYAKANNQGIKIAKGKYILLLNSDTVVKNGCLEKLIGFAQNNQKVGVVGPRLLNSDGTIQGSCFRFPTIGKAISEYFGGKIGLLSKYAPEGAAPTKVDAVVGAAFLVAPFAIKKVGHLDERYWAYFEDIDYCRRVYKKGLEVYYLPEAQVIHYHGVSFAKLNPDQSTRWRTLVPSSKIYHGVFKHYLLNSIIWLGQKWQKIKKENS